MVTPSPLMHIESPEQAQDAIKHNARELLSDRDRLIRWQKWWDNSIGVMER